MCNPGSDSIFPGCKRYHWSLKERNSSVSFKVDHEITECLRLKGTSGGPTPLPKQGQQEPVAHHTVSREFLGVSKETLHSLFEQVLPVLSHVQSKSFLCLERTSSVSLCAHCLLSWQWAAVNKAWFHLLHTFSSRIYIHLYDTSWTFSIFTSFS